MGLYYEFFSQTGNVQPYNYTPIEIFNCLNCVNITLQNRDQKCSRFCKYNMLNQAKEFPRLICSMHPVIRTVIHPLYVSTL